jgi:predicted nucleotidyltransferase
LQLSKRQQAFVERLTAFCDRAAAGLTPVKIEEVWAFGSFIRLKERPGDLDIVVKYSDFHELWKDFDEEMGEVIHSYSQKRGDFLTPADALHLELQKTSDGSPRWETYSIWAKGITWGMVDRDWMLYKGYSWDGITKYLLLENLPRVHIAEMQPMKSDFWLLTDVKILVWSREKPDVQANITNSLSGQQLRENLADELAGFDRQFQPLQFEIKIRTGLYKSLLALPSQAGNESLQFSLESLAKKIFPEEDTSRVAKCLKDPKSFFGEEVREKKAVRSSSDYEALSTRELQNLAETKRVELKAAHDMAEVLRHAVDAAADWIQMPSERRQYFTHYTIEDWIAKCSLSWAGRGAGVEAKVRTSLKTLGLPESRIVYSKVAREYLLPKDQSESEEVASSNARIEVERDIRSKLGPVVRRFNSKLEVYPVLSRDLRPESIRIHYFLSESEKGKDSSADLAWLRTHDFSLEEQPWGTQAKLAVDVTSCNDTPDIISIINRKLSMP